MRALDASCLLLLGAFLAGAEPITYQISGIGSAGIYTDGLSSSTSGFSNAPFSFTLNGNTSNLTTFDTLNIIPLAPSTIAIGSASGTVTDSLGLAAKPSPSSGIDGQIWLYSFGVGNEIVGLFGSDPSFLSYHLLGPLSPVSVSATLNPEQHEEALFINTTFGTLIFSDVSDVTFSASTEPATAPEPATFGLIGVAIVGLGFFARPRSREAAL